MSYPRDLNEYSEAELKRELLKRKRARRKGFCDYCGGALGLDPACRFIDRHNRRRGS